LFGIQFPNEHGEGEEVQMTHAPPVTDPRPTDLPFLFCMLLAARKAQDVMLESLARDWLAEVGVHVVFANELPDAPETKGGRADG
jgi:hypothetical protein